jgi:hypothetical protein
MRPLVQVQPGPQTARDQRKRWSLRIAVPVQPSGSRFGMRSWGASSPEPEQRPLSSPFGAHCRGSASGRRLHSGVRTHPRLAELWTSTPLKTEDDAPWGVTLRDRTVATADAGAVQVSPPLVGRCCTSRLGEVDRPRRVVRFARIGGPASWRLVEKDPIVVHVHD